MCGILGIFYEKGLRGYCAALQAANDMVDYRGPDGSGFVLFDTVNSGTCKTLKVNTEIDNVQSDQITLALGHRRLAIIDLSETGNQPMSNDDGSVWIVYNGEVYNYLELRLELEKAGFIFRSQSDTEVILKSYIKWGENCVDRFNGMWAFAIGDLRHRKIFCSRDRFGIKPFHYFFDGQHFIFGSEIKQLLCFPQVRKQINKRIVYEFLAYAALECSEETFFANIYQLQQGHNLVFDMKDRSLTKTHYYQPQFEINERIRFNEAAEEFRYLLTDSVRLRLRSDVEVGSCLSGGLDSSAIVCLINHLLKKQGKSHVQRTFSSHFDEAEANELKYVEEVIRTTGVKAHFTYPNSDELLQDIRSLVWHQEEPFGSTSIFSQWSVFKLVHQHGIKVMLDGQGADEHLSGYLGLALYFFNELREKRQWLKFLWETWRYTRLQGKPWLSVLPFEAVSFLNKFLHMKDISVSVPTIDYIRPEITERYQDMSYYLKNLQEKPFGKTEHLNNTLYQLTFLNNLQQLLKYEDRNSMAFSVESRLPFLDYRLVEFVFGLPSNFKIRGGYTKRVLRDALSGVLPEKIRKRTSKLGFATPELSWQKTILRPLIEQAIKDERLREFLIPEKTMAYQHRIHKYSIVDFAPWRWVSLYLWMKVYEIG